jgi:hypothetical protein
VELDADMTATQITIVKATNKTREDWMMAEQNLKRAIMDSAGLTIRHIIAHPPLSFQNIMPIDIINAVRAHYGRTTTRTARRLDEILAEKLDNVRNFKTHTAKMQNAFSISTTAGIPMDELTRVKLLRTSILGHHVIDKLIEGYDHEYPFASLCDYLNTHLVNAKSRDADTKAHGLSVQHKGRSEDDILLSMNAEQITAYLAATGEAKNGKTNIINKRRKQNANMPLRHLVQMMTLSNQKKDNESSNNVTAMEPNTRTSQWSVKSWKRTRNVSRTLCAMQQIANHHLEAA